MGLNVSTAADVRTLEAKEVVANTTNFGNDGIFHSPFFVDSFVFASHPLVNWRAGKIHGSAFLVGGNSADGLMERPYGNLPENMTEHDVQVLLTELFQNATRHVQQV